MKGQESSQDFEFARNYVFPPQIFDSKSDKYNFSPNLKHRGKSFVKSINTHERLFMIESPKISKDRTMNIKYFLNRKNETKGRKYSVISGITKNI